MIMLNRSTLRQGSVQATILLIEDDVNSAVPLTIGLQDQGFRALHAMDGRQGLEYARAAQRLPNGNTLICDGAHGTFFEITSEGEGVWKYVNPVTNEGPLTQGDPISTERKGQSNQVFRTYRYGPDYAGLTGKDLTPEDPIELYPDPDCLPGDFDCDCDVDMADITAIAAHWHCETGDPCYDPLYDMDGDGDVDIVDIMEVAIRSGELCD